MLSGSLSASWRYSGTDVPMPSTTTLGIKGGAAIPWHTLSSETLASMYEQSTDRSRGVASEAGSLQQQSSMLKNASYPSLRSTGSSFADLESAGYARHGFQRQEEQDIFSAVGGMELGADADLESLNSDMVSTSGHEPHSEPSRIIFVRHINPAVGDEELLAMFRVFGDVRHVYTISKHRGFVMVTYFDLRDAVMAQASFNGANLSGVPLEVHFCAPKGDPTVNQGTVTVFNLDPDTSNDHMVWLFSKFGDVKDIRESPERSSQKFITYYDTRHALAALRAMNKAEHLGKLPANITPQLAASLSQLTMHDASPTVEGMQRAQHSSGTPRCMKTRDQQHCADVLQAQVVAARQSASRASSQPGTSSPSPLPGTSPVGQVFVAQARHDLQVNASVGLKYLHQQAGQTAQGSQQSLDQMSTGVRTSLHVSDSASSMSSVAGQTATQLLVAAAAAGRSPLGGSALVAGTHCHGPKTVSSLATLTEARALEHQAGLYSTAAGSMLGGGQSGLDQACGGSASDVNATANMLMGLQLGQEQQLWALQQQMAGMAQGQASSGQAGLWAAAAAAAQQQAAAAAAAANLQALRNLQEIQARQQAQQQQQVAMAANLALLQGQALSAADLNAAAAQLLHMAGLGNALGPSSAAASAYLPAAGGLGMGDLNSLASSAGGLGSAAAAQQLLQNAMAIGNVGALSALGSMQAVLGGQAGVTGRLGGSFGSLAGALAGPQGGGGGGSHHNCGGSIRDGAGGSRGGGRLSRRTTDPAAELERKLQQEKLYALDPVKIRNGEDKRTTLMIKNIPNKYTQKMLLATVDEQFKGSYDFFYLPIDFKNKCNVGYAFINMINPFDIIAFVERFNNRRWERFNSEKVCSISYARIQGRAALVAHFQNSSLMHEDKRCRPILFTANGTETTDPEAFQNDPSLQPTPASARGSGASQMPGQQVHGGGGGASGASNAGSAIASIGPARLRAAAAAAVAASASGGGGGGSSVGRTMEEQGGGAVGPPESTCGAGG